MSRTLPVTTLSLRDLSDVAPDQQSVHCYLTDLTDIWQVLSPDVCLERLSPEELARLNQTTRSTSRMRFLAGRSLIRHVLSYYLNLLPERIRIDRSNDGKPYQNHDPQLFFNLSHTGDQFALAVTKKGRVGVDIEQHRWRKHLFSMAQSILAESEKHWFNQLEQTEQERVFYQLWSLKEAILKAEGIGLNLAMNRIGFTEKLCVSQWPKELSTPENWQWQSFQISRLSLAIAVIN